MNYSILWEFEVPESRCAAFEEAYGPEGPWAKLFGNAAGFLGVRLFRCIERAGIYFTVDRWVSEAAFHKFRQDFAAEYHALDKRLEGMASREIRIGAMSEVR